MPASHPTEFPARPPEPTRDPFRLGWLWTERPSLTTNPVLLREMVAVFRRPSSMVQLAVFLVILSLFFLAIWSTMLAEARTGTLDNGMYRLIFMILNLVGGSILMVFIPIHMAACINLERERDTWELIRTTPLTLGSIVLGKFLSGMMPVLMLLFSMIPFFGLLFPLGSVSPWEILFYFVLIIQTAVIIGLLGLLCSIVCRQVITSITATYILGVTYLFAPLITAVILLQEFRYSNIPQLSAFFFAVNPFSFGVWTAEGAASGPVNNWTESWLYGTHYISNALLILGLIVLCLHVLMRQMGASETGTSTTPATVDPFEPEEDLSADDTPDPVHGHWIPDRTNPVFFKEMKTLLKGGQRWLLYLSFVLPFAFAGLLLLLVSLNRAPEADELQALFSISAICLVPLLVLPFGVNMVRGERDRNQWDLVATTTLTSFQILWGKFFAGFRMFQYRFWSFYILYAGITLLAIPYNLARYDWRWIDWTAVRWLSGWFDMVATGVITVLIAYLSATCFLFLAAWISLRLRKTLSAYIVSFMTLLMLYLGLFIAYIILLEFFRMRDWQHELFYVLSVISPPFMLSSFFSSTWLGDWFGFRFFLFMGVYALATQLFFYLCHRTLRRWYENRDS